MCVFKIFILKILILLFYIYMVRNVSKVHFIVSKLFSYILSMFSPTRVYILKRGHFPSQRMIYYHSSKRQINSICNLKNTSSFSGRRSFMKCNCDYIVQSDVICDAIECLWLWDNKVFLMNSVVASNNSVRAFT